MASFGQWFSNSTENKNMIIYGPDRALSRYVLRKEYEARKRCGKKVIVLEFKTVEELKTTLFQDRIEKVCFIVMGFEKARSKSIFSKFLTVSEHEIILYSTAGRIETKESYWKTMSSKGKVVRCCTIQDMKDFLFKNTEATEDGAEALVEFSGMDMSVVSMERKKLVRYLGVEITRKNVERFACRLSWNTFVDDLFLGNKKKLLRDCNNMKINLDILFSIIKKKLIQYLRLFPLKDSRLSFQQMSQHVEMPIYTVRKLILEEMPGLTIKKVVRWAIILNDTYIRRQSGYIDSLLERMIVLW